MRPFEPIAIVGQSALLPGALDPQTLWDQVVAGTDLVSHAPPGRWGLSPQVALTDDPEQSADRAWSDRGGYVQGFEDLLEQALESDPFQTLAADDVRALDPLFQWVLYAGRAALRDSGHRGSTDRVGAVFGNLSFPSSAMSRVAERTWLAANPELAGGRALQLAGIPNLAPHNRFMSGLPAHLLAHELGLGAGAHALDAACASSLYAMKLAADALHDRRADLMLAGAVCRSDDLFIHTGFCALKALSKTGQSRPFHADADGLIPAEGCAFVALKRIGDAIADGDQILGVIRGIGLSNDGRGRGLLAPNSDGQVRAMEAAYAGSGLTPKDVQYVECHATGTTVGDATELRSMARVFADHTDLPIGSLKSNMGHLITTAGAAGLIKVLAAMKAGVRPPTLHVETPNPVLAETPFRPVTKAESWDAAGPRIAAVSAFGFGGNNAHLLVESYEGPERYESVARASVESTPLAIVSMGITAGSATGVDAFREALAGGSVAPRAKEISLPLKSLRFPPSDLKQTLAQQLLLLDAALEATATAGTLDPHRTGVLVGSQSDPEVCRYGARWRLRDWVHAWTDQPDSDWVSGAMDSFVPVLESAGVVGNMPNIPANRLNSQFDFGGPGFTVSSEELSGLTALQIGARMVQSGELDAALIGAVDLSDEPVHRAAAQACLGPDRQLAGDAAVVLVIKRLDDALAAGDAVIATLNPSASASVEYGPQGTYLAERFGHAHAAAALVHVAAAALALRDGTHSAVRVQFDALGGATTSVVLTAPPPGTRAAGTPRDSTGPRFTAPAHPPAVRLPKMSTGPTFSQLETMAPAPQLPSALEDAPALLAGDTGFDGSAPQPALAAAATTLQPPPVVPPMSPPPAAPVAPALAPTLAPSPAASVAPVVAATPPAASTGPFAGFYSHLAEIHSAHMRQQAEVHQAFLQMRANAAQMLANAAAGQPSAPAMPTHAVRPAPAQPPIVPSHQTRAPVPPPAPTATPVRPTASPVTARAPQPVVRPTPPTAPAAPITPPAPAPKTQARSETPSTAPGPVSPGSNMDFDAIVHPPSTLPGPTYDRAQLEVLASDKISKVFPELFTIQDDFPRQVRMPEPPLLLADRVTGIDAEPGSMTTGTIWTESDVTWDDWYLHDGHMPAGVMIESGQADLLLISWLGADFHNKGERVYRLLGCELTYHGGLPQPGDTLKYDIHVDGHANQGDTRIFFFHYDCRVDGELRLAVREGQAGFFSDAELANSGGILWKPEDHELDPNARVDAPLVPCTRTQFDAAQIEAFSNGDGYTCFGEGFEYLQAHVRTPRISPKPMLFFDEVTHCETGAGPWKRGYLRATADISPDDWFFDGHFKDDPCMPGTLMFEGCLQALSFFMTSLGCTIRKDGWRFEPVPDTGYQLRCRGQCTPQSKHLVYEVFVEEIILDGKPTVWADFLCTVDGLKAFHARRVGVQLTPDWPISSRPEWLGEYIEPKPVATVTNPDGTSFDFGYASLMACAWGRPSDAFGPMYRVFDEGRHCARLPGPPYHFMSRLVRIDGDIGAYHYQNAKAAIGTEIELEYDVPPDSWYFDQNGNRTMPFAVLLEAALQPCGWIACYVGSALTTDEDLYFRNLDGTGTLTAEIWPESGTLRTVAKITNISNAGGMIIQSFEVACFLGDTQIYELNTVFGFFPTDALANQIGITPTEEDRAALLAPSDFNVDLTTRPERYCAGALRLPDPMLLMLDRVVGYWPEGGKKGLGRMVSEKDVNPAEWFFKAHFYSDPVQPGSLGIEAMIQLLQFYMLENDMHQGMSDPRFEPLQLGQPLKWSYRGQVVPRNNVIRCEIDIVDQGEDEQGRFAICDAYLWVDDLRIYSAHGMGMRIVDGADALQALGTGESDYPFSSPRERRAFTEQDIEDTLHAAPKGRSRGSASSEEATLDPKGWVADHQPTWTLPALPAMSMLDLLAQAATTAGGTVIGARNIQVHRWLPVDTPTRIRVSPGTAETLGVHPATLEVWREAGRTELSRFEPVCDGDILIAETWAEAPDPWEVPTGGTELNDPYAGGSLFHGPAFQYLTHLRMGEGYSVATLEPSRGSVPWGTLGQGLLDALTHGIPHDSMHTWSSDCPPDHAAYPWRIESLDLFGALPADGEITVVSRFVDMASSREPRVAVQAQHAGVVLAELTLVEILLPKGPVGEAAPSRRLAFLRDRQPAQGLGLSTTEDQTTRVSAATIKGSDWLLGTVAAVYGLADAPTPAAVAARDHVARLAQVHPSAVRIDGDTGRVANLPLHRFPLEIEATSTEATIRSAGPITLDLEPVRTHWDTYFQAGRWPVEDLYYGLIERFIGKVVVEDPSAMAAVHGRSCLFVANHQVAVESLLASIIASGLIGVNTTTLAKAEHRETWLGKLIAHCFSYPDVPDPEVIAFFDRSNRRSLFGIIERLRDEMIRPGKSVLVHVEGTRSLDCRTPVTVLGAAFIDMALKANAPIIPVRFAGALPVEPLDSRIEFPLGMTRQDLYFGEPLLPETLSAIPLRERKQTVLDALNRLGPTKADEVPNPPDAAFDARVRSRMATSGADHEHATLFEVLRDIHTPTEPIARLLGATKKSQLKLSNSPEDQWLKEIARRLGVPTRA